jgi:hypothetical protein
MIADAGPRDEIRRDMADFADEVRNAIPGIASVIRGRK